MTRLDPDFHRLLRHLHAGGAWSYWWYLDAVQTNAQGEPRKRSVWWPVSKPGTPEPTPTEHVYFGVHPCHHRRGSGQRATIQTIAVVNGLFAEFDDKDRAGGREATLAHVAALAPPPSVVIDSGGGLHCYWLLRETLTLDDAQRREDVRRLQATWVAYTRSDPGSKDLARVLRVPGFRNRKPVYAPDFPLVQVLQADFSQQYAHAELAAVAQAAQPPEEMPTRNTPALHPTPPWAESAQAAAYLERLAAWRCEDYNSWLAVGMALTALGLYGLALWESWSQQSAKYQPGVCERKWLSFTQDPYGLAKLGAWANEDQPIRRSTRRPAPTRSSRNVSQNSQKDAPGDFANIAKHEHNSPHQHEHREQGTTSAGSASRPVHPREQEAASETASQQSQNSQKGAPGNFANSANSVRESDEDWSAGDDEDDEWTVPLSLTQLPVPPFPVAVLPPWLHEMVTATAHATQTPPDLAAMLALAVLATGAQKKIKLQVRPGWCEPVNLYTMTALPPGSRKSAVFSVLVGPVLAFEAEQAVRDRAENARNETAQEIKQGRLSQLKQDAARARTDQEREQLTSQAVELAQELSNATVPPIRQLVTDDITPERLAGLLRDQGGCISVLSSEGDIFEIMSGRYSRNGSANFAIFLKAYTGDFLRVERQRGAPIAIQEPALTMGLTVQPAVLQGLRETPAFRSRGLLGRFLYALPPSLLGQRVTNPEPVPSAVTERYCRALKHLLGLPMGTDDRGAPAAHILRLEGAARHTLEAFEAWVEPRLAEFGELGAMTDWGGKVVGAVARIIALLHVATHIDVLPWTQPIAPTTAAQGVEIGRYLIAHARAAYAEMGADAELALAQRVLHWLDREQPVVFRKRELFEGVKGTCKRVERLDPILVLLRRHGYVRRVAGQRRRGRPSEQYTVNPLWAFWHHVPARGEEPLLLAPITDEPEVYIYPLRDGQYRVVDETHRVVVGVYTAHEAAEQAGLTYLRELLGDRQHR